MGRLRITFYFFALIAAAAVAAQKFDPTPPEKESATTKEEKPPEPEATDDAEARRKLKGDAEKEADELPFGPLETEKRENVFGDKKEKDAILKRMEYQIAFIAEGAGFNNTDFRALDESTTASIQNTDDKQTLAFSRFYVNLYWRLTDDLSFRFDIFKNGFWGHDQLAGASSNNNSASTSTGVDPFNFGELNLSYVIWKNVQNEFSVKIGRQFFEIGGETYDYFLKDYLDALTFKYANATVGGFRVLAFDAFQLGADPTTHANYVRFFSHDNQRVRFFDGDVNVLRAGFVYDSRNLLHWKGSLDGDPGARKRGGDAAHEVPLSGALLQNKLYAFGARYGAVSRGGADRASPGTPGNFADNDYNVLFGTRFIFNVPRKNYVFKTFVDAALSTGLDRRLPTAANESRDVDTNGYAFAGGGTFEWLQIASFFDMDFAADGFYASGSKYDQSGAQTSHGFTSLKGSRMGGLIMSRFYGIRPSSYTDSSGFADSPHDYERKAPAAFFHWGIGTTFWKKLRLAIDYWMAFDTSKSQLYADARANSTTASITSAVLKAQDRLGKILGQEINFSVDWSINQYWTLYLRTGVFLPAAFYSTPGIVTDTPYGTDNAMGVQLGSKLIF